MGRKERGENIKEFPSHSGVSVTR